MHLESMLKFRVLENTSPSQSDTDITDFEFSNSTAESNGGVLYTYSYPTKYTIISSSFSNDQAGGDGGTA